MSKAGDRFENPITGEYGYTRIGTEETGGKLLVSDLRVRPGTPRAKTHRYSTTRCHSHHTSVEPRICIRPSTSALPW